MFTLSPAQQRSACGLIKASTSGTGCILAQQKSMCKIGLPPCPLWRCPETQLGSLWPNTPLGVGALWQFLTIAEHQTQAQDAPTRSAAGPSLSPGPFHLCARAAGRALPMCAALPRAGPSPHSQREFAVLHSSLPLPAGLSPSTISAPFRPLPLSLSLMPNPSLQVL